MNTPGRYSFIGNSIIPKGVYIPAEYYDTLAAALGIEPKRLLGFMARNGIADPIGDGELVYGWSCKGLAERLVRDRESEVVK